jgi:hypothetical protein
LFPAVVVTESEEGFFGGLAGLGYVKALPENLDGQGEWTELPGHLR